VNGNRQHIFRVDGALMGVLVPVGSSVVDFVFRPTRLFLGLALAVIAAAFLISALWISHRRGEEQEAPAGLRGK
jgi:uncharacterized membrane protein YfhO